ncbi:peptidoglycan-binding domain-containing protein [Thalassovita sp.]|uniref:peptidoglycan-binding domain-containing protein n=1 Tax=Thalassovita sp. TaxID=1979401 RepID=UPI0029DE74A1|nr:peptidoglycan-binding domain-containing protein [Thalassovita sp.]
MPLRVFSHKLVIIALCVLFLTPATVVSADEDTRDVQQILSALGYNPGPLDGLWGGSTARALEAYAASEGLAFEGALTTELYDHLVARHPGLATGYRHLEAALDMPQPPLFPLENDRCLTGQSFDSVSSANYYKVVDRDVHGATRIGGFIKVIGYVLANHISARSRETPAYQSGRPDEDFRSFLAHLENAAADHAFTELFFAPGGGPSPAHWVSALLNNLSYLVNYTDRVGLWRDDDQRAALISWGNRIYHVSHNVSGPGKGREIPSVRWPDTLALQALAYVNWGLATSSPAAFSEGVEDWFTLFNLLEANGGLRTFLNGGRWQGVAGPENNDFYYDNALGFMVIAAVSSQTVGIDLFSQVRNGATLHDAIEWRLRYVTDWERLANVSSQPLYDDYEGRRRYWQRSSFGGNWGWTEAYIGAFPDTDLAIRLARVNSERVGTGRYSSATMGPASCLYGLHR